MVITKNEILDNNIQGLRELLAGDFNLDEAREVLHEYKEHNKIDFDIEPILVVFEELVKDIEKAISKLEKLKKIKRGYI